MREIRRGDTVYMGAGHPLTVDAVEEGWASLGNGRHISTSVLTHMGGASWKYQPAPYPINIDVSAGARDALLQLMASWGLNSGRGAREKADAILNAYAHELAEKIRNFRCLGCECVPDQCRIDHQTQAFDADLIDPEVSSG